MFSWLGVILSICAIFGVNCIEGSLTLKSTEGCSLLPKEISLYSADLNSFTNNSPKKNEVFRIKLYFIGKSPMIRFISNRNLQNTPIFAFRNDFTEYALFNNLSDWMNHRNSIEIQQNVSSFSSEKLTEIDSYLRKGKKIYFFFQFLNNYLF